MKLMRKKNEKGRKRKREEIKDILWEGRMRKKGRLGEVEEQEMGN
jgi:hypothetical protein